MFKDQKYNEDETIKKEATAIHKKSRHFFCFQRIRQSFFISIFNFDGLIVILKKKLMQIQWAFIEDCGEGEGDRRGSKGFRSKFSSHFSLPSEVYV